MISGLEKSSKKNFSLVTVSNFFMFCNFSSFFLLPLYILELGGDRASIGYVMGSFGFTSLGAIPIVGYAIDKYGRRKFMLLGAAIMFLASISNVFITELNFWIYLPRIAQGVGFAFFFTSATTAAADYLPAGKRGEGLGMFGAFTIASYAVGPTVGEFVIEQFGFNAFFCVMSGFSLIAFLIALPIKDAILPRSGSSSTLDYMRLVFSRRFASVFLSNIALSGGFGAMLVFMSAYLRSKNLEVYHFFIIYALTVVLVRVFGGKIADIFDRRKVAAPSLLIFSFSVAALALIDSFWSLILIALVFSLSYALLYPTLSALVVDKAMPEERGRVIGAFNACFSIGINFLAFGFGVIANNWGFETMYITAAFSVFIGFLIFTYFEFVKRE